MKLDDFLKELDNPICKMGAMFERKYCGGLISQNKMREIISREDSSLDVLISTELHFRTLKPSRPTDSIRADEVQVLIKFLLEARYSFGR